MPTMPGPEAARSLVPVLAGGGTRLPAHVGVLAALADFGISVPSYVGVSGGSIVAATSMPNRATTGKGAKARRDGFSAASPRAGFSVFINKGRSTLRQPRQERHVPRSEPFLPFEENDCCNRNQ